MARSPRFTIALVATALTASSLTFALAPAASAAPDASGVTMSADGFGVALASTVQMWDGVNPNSPNYISRDGTVSTFGNGMLTTFYGSKGTANAYFLARGGYVKKTGGTCDASGTYYQRSRVTLTGLAAGTKDVWAFWDGSASESTAQWEDAQFGNPTVTGSPGDATVTVDATQNIDNGDFAYGTGIAAGARVLSRSGSVVTLSAVNSGAVSGTGYFGARAATTTNVPRLCDGTTYFVENVSDNGGTSGLAVLPLGTGGGVVFNDAAGLRVNDTTATTVSFDVYVPTSGGASQGWKSLSLGLVVDLGGAGIDASTDYGIQTQVYARPWTENWGPGAVVDTQILTACAGSPSASDPACLAGIATDNGVFASDGTTRVGTASDYSVQLQTMYMPSGGGMPSMTGVTAKVGLVAAATNSTGFEVPDGSIVKFILSLPTTGTVNGINYANANFLESAGQTTMKVDPANVDHAWQLATASGRTTFTFRGQATTTSRAVSKLTWTDNCQIEINGSTVSDSGCSADANSLVVDTVPTTANLNYQDNPVMKTIGGGFVSTNAQGMNFGAETMLGQSFQFAVAGPSVNEAGNPRTTAGYYYVCVPAAFLAGSFGTTPASAASTWQGTRDGAVISSGVSFAAGTCGVGPGLVASYPQFGYSAPLFSVRPPAATPSSSSSGSSTPAAATTAATTTTTTPAATTPAATPSVVLPAMTATSQLRPGYLLGLADLTPPKGAEVKITVPKMFRSVCAVRDGKVVTIGTGTCGVRIKVIGPKGKVTVKRVYLAATA